MKAEVVPVEDISIECFSLLARKYQSTLSRKLPSATSMEASTNVVLFQGRRLNFAGRIPLSPGEHVVIYWNSGKLVEDDGSRSTF